MIRGQVCFQIYFSTSPNSKDFPTNYPYKNFIYQTQQNFRVSCDNSVHQLYANDVSARLRKNPNDTVKSMPEDDALKTSHPLFLATGDEIFILIFKLVSNDPSQQISASITAEFKKDGRYLGIGLKIAISVIL